MARLVVFFAVIFSAMALLAAPAMAHGNGHAYGHTRHAQQQLVIECNPFEQNVIVGSLGPDFLQGTPCNDTIYGLPGNDVLVGNGGRDILFGGNGRDSLRGVDGRRDQLRGGSGFDTCIGDQFDQFVSCEADVVIVV